MATHGMPGEVAVSLDVDPLREVTIPLSADYGEELTPQQVAGITASLTFESGETRKTFRVTPVEGVSGTVDLSFGTLPARINAGSLSETSITIHNTKIWESVLTIGAVVEFLGYGTFVAETEGSLTASEFWWRGTEYTVNSLLVSGLDDQGYADVELDISPGFDEETDGLYLGVGDLALNLADGKVNTRQF